MYVPSEVVVLSSEEEVEDEEVEEEVEEDEELEEDEDEEDVDVAVYSAVNGVSLCPSSIVRNGELEVTL